MFDRVLNTPLKSLRRMLQFVFIFPTSQMTYAMELIFIMIIVITIVPVKHKASPQIIVIVKQVLFLLLLCFSI